MTRSGAALAAVTAILLTAAPAAAGTPPSRAPSQAAPAAAGGPRSHAAPAVGAPDTADLPAYLRDRQARDNIPGLAVAVVHGDQVIRSYAEGETGDGEAVTATTPFLIGSVSKPITATAVLGLVEDGLIGLDDPVRRHLPDFRTTDEPASDRVTVRHLLTHTSGLPDVAGTRHTDRFDNEPGGLDRALQSLAEVRPIAAPGEAHEYSSGNYIVLGALVEAVTGRTFAEQLRRTVVEPLDMRHTATTAAEAERVGVPAGHRTYLGRPQRFDSPYDTSGVPYGYVAASVTDLSHFATAQLNGGRYGTSQLVEPETVERMHRGTAAISSGGAYGLGWRDTTLDQTGARIVWHGGALPGYFAHLLVVPDADLAVVVLANRYSLADDGPLTSIGFDVVRMLTGGSAEPAAADPMLTWLAPALLAVAGVLALALIGTVVRGVRRLRAGPRGAVTTGRSGRRAVIATAGWVLGYGLLAGAVSWGLPSLFGGRGLDFFAFWMPDVRHAVIAVVALAVSNALVRVGLTVATVRAGRATVSGRAGSTPDAASRRVGGAPTASRVDHEGARQDQSEPVSR
ncbi:serine hydrolase domain-containing protein [Plantactinospora sp. GCM10030261]